MKKHKMKIAAGFLFTASLFMAIQHANAEEIHTESPQGSSLNQFYQTLTQLDDIGQKHAAIAYETLQSHSATIQENLAILEAESKNRFGEVVKKGALDWFQEVQYIFARGTDAIVIDVETEKTFSVRRTFGTNHADVEPLTTEDAQTIQEIWGGWSWERRAVVVIVDGHFMAGSMTAMPHAGVDNAPAVDIVDNRSGGYGRGQNLDAVKGNGVDGHMDIHFLNSRTHGTNVMQEVHQNMVRKAENYMNEKF